MPKRGAEQYITKENGTIANSDAGEEKPKMSTAAQLAKRKMATPRGRLGANRPSHTSNTNSSNPFASSAPQQQPPTFGPVSGGITFGASSSFPTGDSSSNSSFNFQPPQSSSFTFGAPPSGSNPFANLSDTTNSTSNGTADISMESPQKKTAFGNAFGSAAAGNNTSSVFGSVQPVQPPASGGFTFGAVQQDNNTANMNGGGLFGRVSKPEQPVAPSNLFGQSSQAQSVFGGFGQPSSTPSFTFGQTNPSSAAPSQAPTFISAQSNSTTSTQPPLFGFGQNTTSQNQTPAFSFGQNAASTQEKQPSTSSGSSSPFKFGQTQPSQSSNPFASIAAPKNEEQKVTSPLFGSVSNSQSPAATPERSTSPEKQAGSDKTSDETPKNPFAGLFGQTNNPSPANSTPKPVFSFGAPAQSAPTPEASTQSAPTPGASTQSKPPTFSFGQTSSSANQVNVTTSKASATDNQDVQPVAEQEKEKPVPKSPFGFSSQPAPSSGGLFSPTQPATQQNAPTGIFSGLGSSATSANPSTSSSDQANSVNSNRDSSYPAAVTTPKAPVTFGASSQPESTPASPKPSGLFGMASQADLSKGTNADKPSSRPELPDQAASKPDLFEMGSRTQGPSDTSTVPSVTSDGGSKRPVYTKAAPIIPGHLQAEQYRDYDRNYRLHSLNLGLQAKLAKLDPRSHDFDGLIRHYVAARETIGASLGLYLRSTAGMKRKGDDVEQGEEDVQKSKKQRSDNTSGTAHAGPSHPSSFAASGTKPTQPSSALSDTTQQATPNKTTELFKGMIPGSNTQSSSSIPQSGSKPSGNPFAGLAPTPVPATNVFANLGRQTESAQKSLPADTTSTTPTKSPPKKPAFEAPKFGSASSNFTTAFGQQAKASADKLSKSIIEKRKAEDFDSEDDDEEAFNKQAEEELRSKRAKIEAISKGGFTPIFGSRGTTSTSKPALTFGSASASTNNQNATSGFSGFPTAASEWFSSGNEFTSTSIGQESNVADSSSDDKDVSRTSGEDDDRYATGTSGETDDKDVTETTSQQEQGSEDDEYGESDQEQEDESPGDEVVPEENQEESDSEDDDMSKVIEKARRRERAVEEASANANAAKSLFDRIEPNPEKGEKPNDGSNETTSRDSGAIMQSAKNSSFPAGVWGSHIGKSTPEQPTFSPFTPAASQSASTYKPATTFNFTATPASNPSPTPGASIFSGGLTRNGPVPGEGLFGSRPSTPTNTEKSTGTPGTSQTWKKGDPIVFGNGDSSAPSFKFTAPTPAAGKESDTAKPFASLFGNSNSSKPAESSNNLGFSFGTPATIPAPGFLGAVSHLGGGSVASTNSSRATSPGLTDNESVATNDTEDSTDDPQTSLMESRAGEENEACLWEGRSKALLFVNEKAAEGTKLKANDWNSMGVGQVRVLKDKTSGKTRVVFRVEPSASILINSHLVDSITYESVPSQKSGAVKGTLFYKNNLTRWVFKVKTPEMGEELARVMEENKNA